MLCCVVRGMALVASAAKARRQKTRKSAFGRFFFVRFFVHYARHIPQSNTPAHASSCGKINLASVRYQPVPAQPRGHPLQYGSLRRGQHRGATRHQAGVTPQLPSRDLFMKFIVWLIRVLVFVLLLVLALSNTQTATLNFLAGYAWSAPLILIGLAFFVVGLLAGLVSSMPAMVRLRMENGRLKRELRVAREAPVVVEQPPMPPLI